MNFKSIRYFITLAHCLNFTQAASKYHITQTAMSRYIASLEEQMGVRLFERSSRKVTLTEAGRLYAEGVEKILEEHEELLEKVKAAANNYQGHIKVGLGIYEYSNTEQYFSRFLEMYSDIKIDIFQYPYSTLTERFKQDSLDLIISLDMCREEFRKEEIRTVDLFSSENVLVISSRKKAEYENLSVEEILKQEYLVTNCEDNGLNSMKMLKQMLERDLGFVPEHIIQTNSLGAQLLMVKTGHGAAIVPAFVKEIRDESMAVLKLPQKAPQRYCVIQKRDCGNDAATLFMDFCQSLHLDAM